MTIQRLKRPMAWAVSLLIYAAILEYVLPPRAESVLRFFNGFSIITLLGWLSLRRLDDDAARVIDAALTQQKLDNVIAMVTDNEANRLAAVTQMVKQTEDIALRLEAETDRRREIAEHALHAQTTTLSAKIQEGTTASAAAADAAKESVHVSNNVTEKLAGVDLRLEDLNQRLLEKLEKMPPRDQQDDIQKTVHDSHDILGTLVEQRPDGKS